VRLSALARSFHNGDLIVSNTINFSLLPSFDTGPTIIDGRRAIKWVEDGLPFIDFIDPTISFRGSREPTRREQLARDQSALSRPFAESRDAHISSRPKEWAIDHIIPFFGVLPCGSEVTGLDWPHNWQLLPTEANGAKQVKVGTVYERCAIPVLPTWKTDEDLREVCNAWIEEAEALTKRIRSDIQSETDLYGGLDRRNAAAQVQCEFVERAKTFWRTNHTTRPTA
jgi:hypothetical protein